MQTMDGMGRSDTFLSAAACSDLANPDWPLQGQHLPGFGCPPPAASYLYEVRGHGVRERSQSRLRYRLEPPPRHPSSPLIWRGLFPSPMGVNRVGSTLPETKQVTGVRSKRSH